MASFGFDSLQDDPELAGIARFASELCDVPMAMVTLVEQERQRFLAHEGLNATETPRPTSFCAHAMLGSEIMVIPDATADSRFADNPLVTGGPGIRFYAGAPLISPEGAPLGALCVIDREVRPQGLTSLQREGLETLAAAVMRRFFASRLTLKTARALHARDAQFQLFADTIPDIAWSANAAGDPDYLNSRYYEFTGHQPGSVDARVWREPIHPDDLAPTVAIWDAAHAAGEPYEAEHRYRRADGAYRWMLSRAVPVRGEDGAVVRWVGTLTDIDDNHRLSDNRDLLTRELSHRIKNIFSVISGLISLRARGKPELADFAENLNATIRALGRAQGFVRPVEREGGDDLIGLLEVLMEPYCSQGHAQVSISGDTVPVSAAPATPIALVFHELATNSAKYGALSTAEGKVAIEVAKIDEENIAVQWRESGGPPVSQPGTNGFGSRLIAMAVENQLGGQIVYDWEPAGLRVHLELARAHLVV